MVKSWTPKDIVALSVIAGLIAFKLTGHNGSLDVAVAIIIGYYFAHRKLEAPPTPPPQAPEE